MSREAVVEAATEATDVVFDTIEAVPEVVRNNPFVIAAVGLTSAVIASGVSIFITRKILKTKYEHLIAEEIHEVKQHYKKQFKDGEYSDPAALADQLEDDDLDPQTVMMKGAAQILEEQRYVPYEKVAIQEKDDSDSEEDVRVDVVRADVTVTQNVFTLHGDGTVFNTDAEDAKRTAGNPYIIEETVFLENEEDYTQTTLTWYEGDRVLVDDRDQALHSYDKVIGADNLKFGYGSNDPNIVYVRNDRFKADYEIILSEERYTEVVLGMKTARERRPSKTRRFPRDED